MGSFGVGWTRSNMRLLGAFCLFFMVGFSTAFDDEEAKLAESVDLPEALEEHYDPENIHDDENEKVELDEVEDEDEESYSSPPPLPPWMLQQKPWWYFLPPWMHPGFMPGAPPLVEEKYMRELDDDSEMPDYEIPDDLFPEPEFPPIDYMDLSDDPMEMYPFMDFPPMLDENDEEDEEDETLHRSRREALVDTMTIHDPNEWWHDLDSGVSNAVTKKLARNKTGIASQYMMKDALDHYGPALHLGEIDTGYLRNPELEQASDRTFGKDSDFYLGDMDAFRFTPKGERYQSFKEFKNYKGHMALGRRFILHNLFFNGCEKCWINKKLKNVKNVREQTYNPNMFVDPLLSHETYWHQISCDNFMPGQYMLLAFKERKGKVYMYFQDQFGRQIAVADPNFNGMQAASPYSRQTAIHSLYYPSDGSKSYYALQPDVSHINNAAYTHTGGRWGEDYLGDYKGYSEYDAPYDESQVWMLNTGRMAPKSAQTNFKQKRYNLNAVDQPTEQFFEFSGAGGDVWTPPVGGTSY